MGRESFPPPLIVQPKSKHVQTFILLHGLGSNGEKFGTELLDTGISSSGKSLSELYPGARFIFPTAKKRRSSAFSRALVNQWFDIASLDDVFFKQETQCEGLADSAQYLLQLIQQEMELVQPQHMILGGLSHGCAMALALMLCLDFSLGGFIGMSGWLPFERDIGDILNKQSRYNEDNSIDDDIFEVAGGAEQTVDNDLIAQALQFQRGILSTEHDKIKDIKTPLSTPVFIGHGAVDENVKVSLGEDIVRTLQALGVRVIWKRYEGQGHWYQIPDEIDDIVQFVEVETPFTKR
jgi:predicted esterase